jgi:sulfonate transport system substrate-binding protein
MGGEMRLPKLLIAAATAIIASYAQAEEPLKLRVGWIVPVTNLASYMYGSTDVMRHYGRSYVVETVRFQGSTPQLIALATGDLDIGLLGFTSFPLAIQNARMDDLRIIVDEFRDGVAGHYSNEFMVRADSGMRSVADLKGRVLATNAAGSAVDIAMRAMLRQGGLENRDFTVIEGGFANMRALLLEKKVDLVPAVPPFARDPELRAKSTVLFTEGQALGPNMLGIWVARRGFLEKNRAAMVDLLEDYLRAVAFMTDPNNRKLVVQLAAAAAKLPPEALEGWLFTDKDYFRPADGLVDVASLQSNIDSMRKLGFINQQIDAGKYVDMSLVREAAARLK